MNSYVALFALLACASAAPSTIVQGPSSRSTIVGPDGSAISSVSPGGAIVAEDSAALIARAAPLAYAAPLTYAAPIHAAAYSAPLYGQAIAAPHFARTAYTTSHLGYAAAPALAYTSGALLGERADTVIAGPSGTIATSKTVPYGHLAYSGLYY